MTSSIISLSKSSATSTREDSNREDASDDNSSHTIITAEDIIMLTKRFQDVQSQDAEDAQLLHHSQNLLGSLSGVKKVTTKKNNSTHVIISRQLRNQLKTNSALLGPRIFKSSAANGSGSSSSGSSSGKSGNDIASGNNDSSGDIGGRGIGSGIADSSFMGDSSLPSDAVFPFGANFSSDNSSKEDLTTKTTAAYTTASTVTTASVGRTDQSKDGDNDNNIVNNRTADANADDDKGHENVSDATEPAKVTVVYRGRKLRKRNRSNISTSSGGGRRTRMHLLEGNSDSESDEETQEDDDEDMKNRDGTTAVMVDARVSSIIRFYSHHRIFRPEELVRIHGSDGLVELDFDNARLSNSLRKKIIERVEYRKRHKLPPPDEPEVLLTITKVKRESIVKCIRWCRYHCPVMRKGMKAPTFQERDTFDKNFVKTDPNELCELASASYYLDVKPLIDLTCHAIAKLIKNPAALQDFSQAIKMEEAKRSLNSSADLPSEQTNSKTASASANTARPSPNERSGSQANARKRTVEPTPRTQPSRQPNPKREKAKRDPRSVDDLLSFINDGDNSTAEEKKKKGKGKGKKGGKKNRNKNSNAKTQPRRTSSASASTLSDSSTVETDYTGESDDRDLVDNFSQIRFEEEPTTLNEKVSNKKSSAMPEKWESNVPRETHSTKKGRVVEEKLSKQRNGEKHDIPRQNAVVSGISEGDVNRIVSEAIATVSAHFRGLMERQDLTIQSLSDQVQKQKSIIEGQQKTLTNAAKQSKEAMTLARESQKNLKAEREERKKTALQSQEKIQSLEKTLQKQTADAVALQHNMISLQNSLVPLPRSQQEQQKQQKQQKQSNSTEKQQQQQQQQQQAQQTQQNQQNQQYQQQKQQQKQQHLDQSGTPIDFGSSMFSGQHPFLHSPLSSMGPDSVGMSDLFSSLTAQSTSTVPSRSSEQGFFQYPYGGSHNSSSSMDHSPISPPVDASNDSSSKATTPSSNPMSFWS